MPNTRVLIVEDDELNVIYLEEVLKIPGYEITAVVASGELAVQAAAADLPDIVLMDIMLAGEMDGIEAADGRAAVQQVKQLYPDVVVMDIAMPELNGIEATQHIHADCPATHVVILSVHATAEHIFRALQAGARGYVLKEAAGKEVVKAVRTVYAGRRYLSAKITDAVIEDYLHAGRTAQSKSPLEHLSQREREVLQLVVEGKSSAEIAAMIFLSSKTVETYRSRIMQKLGIQDLPGLVKFAIQHGLTPLE